MKLPGIPMLFHRASSNSALAKAGESPAWIFHVPESAVPASGALITRVLPGVVKALARMAQNSIVIKMRIVKNSLFCDGMRCNNKIPLAIKKYLCNPFCQENNVLSGTEIYFSQKPPQGVGGRPTEPYGTMKGITL
jgi:hypothetical protein